MCPARGHWRLDWVALVRLERRVEPLRLAPTVVTRDSIVDDNARRLYGIDPGFRPAPPPSVDGLALPPGLSTAN